MTSNPTAACPCGRGVPYAECCGPLHGGAKAPSAERTMRARYSAYALGNTAYLLASWHPDTRPGVLELDPLERWVGLEILGTTGGGMLDTTGTVEFIARFREGQRQGELREISRFSRVDGAWVYVDPDDADLLTLG